MQKWYVLRRDSEFTVIQIDQQGALLMKDRGWQLGARPFDSREEAEREEANWRARYDTAKNSPYE